MGPATPAHEDDFPTQRALPPEAAITGHTRSVLPSPVTTDGPVAGVGVTKAAFVRGQGVARYPGTSNGLRFDPDAFNPTLFQIGQYDNEDLLLEVRQDGLYRADFFTWLWFRDDGGDAMVPIWMQTRRPDGRQGTLAYGVYQHAASRHDTSFGVSLSRVVRLSAGQGIRMIMQQVEANGYVRLWPAASTLKVGQESGLYLTRLG